MAIVKGMDENELRRQIVAIQLDATLNEAEKAKKRQALLSGRWQEKGADDEGKPGVFTSKTLGALCNCHFTPVATVESRCRAACLNAGSSKEANGMGAASEVAGATMFDESLNCTMCMELCNRPVTVGLLGQMGKR